MSNTTLFCESYPYGIPVNWTGPVVDHRADWGSKISRPGNWGEFSEIKTPLFSVPVTPPASITLCFEFPKDNDK